MSMPIHVSDRQLDRIEHGREPGVVVRSARTKKGYAVISEDAYDQLRPLLQCVAMQVEHPPTKNGHATAWPEEKNARRAALVNKKYDSGLTAAEKKELAVLSAEVDDYLSRADQVRNKILELVLAGLKQEISKKAKR